MVVVDILVFVAVGLYLSRIGLGSGRDGAAAVGHTRYYAHVCGSVAYRDGRCTDYFLAFCRYLHRAARCRDRNHVETNQKRI